MVKGRLLLFWIFVAPVVLFGILAAVGSIVDVAWRAWYVAGPLLLGYVLVVWRWMKPRADAPASFDAITRTIATAIMVGATLGALGLIYALVSWAGPNLIYAAPFYLAFAGWVVWGVGRDRSKAAAAARAKTPAMIHGSGPGDGSKMIR